MRLKYEPAAEPSLERCGPGTGTVTAAEHVTFHLTRSEEMKRRRSDVTPTREGGKQQHVPDTLLIPLLSEYSTHRTVKAIFWPWFSGTSR